MKKVININFQGQVIAIEETAYEILKRYIESLQRYFSREDGGEEIVNDIENRIAELFGNRLKLGINCITDEDVESVINNIGRPEDFDSEYEEFEEKYGSDESKKTENSGDYQESRQRLFRNSNDKIIAGVCSGIANYLKTDPAWIRLIFVLFFGVLFWVYLVMWIILKQKPLQSNVTRRLYRNPNDKYIAGVCGGIATYFKMDSWIPRVIFLLPFILSMVSVFSFFPFNIFGGSKDFNININGGMILIYFLLWIIIPKATSVKQKLEMMGEEEYIRSIRNAVNGGVSGTRSSAEYKETPSVDGMPPVPPTQDRKDDVHRDYSSSEAERSGCLNAIIVFFKIIFFSFIGIIALAMLGITAGILFAGMPLKMLIFNPGMETKLMYLSVILVMVVPVVAIVIWIIRKLMRAKSRPFIGASFTVLWFLGLILSFILATKVVKKFDVESSKEQIVEVQPTNSNVLYVDMLPYKDDYSEFDISSTFMGLTLFSVDGDDLDDLPYKNVDEDSLLFNDINLVVGNSPDSLFHVRTIYSTAGRSLKSAKSDLETFSYNIQQNDSLLLIPEFFTLPIEQGFRFQNVTVELSVPVGKAVEVSDRLSRYKSNDVSGVPRRRIRSYDSSYTPEEEFIEEYTFQ